MPLPKPPTEIPRIFSLAGLAPGFRRAIEAVLIEMQKERVFETLRTDERQRFLYGFGREYDDPIHPRGRVTDAKTAMLSWHFFGLAVDIVEDDATPWVAPNSFWQSLGLAYEKHDCKWGGRWDRVDLPHGYWAKCRRTPSQKSRDLYARGGLKAVWEEVGAL